MQLIGGYYQNNNNNKERPNPWNEMLIVLGLYKPYHNAYSCNKNASFHAMQEQFQPNPLGPVFTTVARAYT